MSTKTFGTPFTTWLLTLVLGFFHLAVSPHTFDLLQFCLRKLAHMSEYAIFALFLYHAVSRDHRSIWRPKLAILCVVIAAVYSFTDEFHQSFVPGRGSFEIQDCGIDTLGAIIGMILLYLFRERPAGEGDQTELAPSSRAQE